MRAILHQIEHARAHGDYAGVTRLLGKLRSMLALLGIVAAADPAEPEQDPIVRRIAEDEAGARMADESHDDLLR